MKPGIVRVPVWNTGIWRQPLLSRLLERPVRAALLPLAGATPGAWAGWGAKPSARRAQWYAARSGASCLRLEDGFLRSYGTGKHSPGLSLVVDEQGIYYDSTRPSALESLLASDTDLLQGIADEVARARSLVLAHRLSKYNHAPELDPCLLRAQDRQRVLVIDQTAGDLSVDLGGADAATFTRMLAAARAENPGATVYVKTHPEVSAGHKGGYLTRVADDERTVVLRQPINPLSLIERMDRVYVVTSTMGFEALLAGKPVSVFGMPWYAGWGATDDRQTCSRRLPLAGRRRSVDELFAAAYFHYTRYLDPVTHRGGSIFDVIDWLVRQREMAARRPGRVIGVGFRRWKAANVKPLLALDSTRTQFVATAAEAAGLAPQPRDSLVFWGRDAPAGLAQLAQRSGARLVRMEDGFARSVGLGSDLIRPLSLVLDERGIYFDPTQVSDLEQILATAAFGEEELRRAAQVRTFIVHHGVTKYNLEPRERAPWTSAGREVVLVPGQVEDDASIRYGCVDVKTNLGLLEAARRAHPDAFIVYKPHPDVMSGNRAGSVALAQASHFADLIETRLSVVSCIDACDVVHTMTSLTGFDALLRGKRVVVYGQPFYAGWGLTEDVLTDGVAFGRRQRRLSLDELVAGTLLRYPLYWDWQLKGYASCEAVLRQLVETRTALEHSGELEKLRLGWLRRQRRKLAILAQAMLAQQR
ncbi:capsular polysaccharide biosynthesis protein [Massilia sp.]|uniref:capsular polysaccharide biosynthesis protein n=1 Tax=Massilia sp. TaxID=1882437 RepID=UPI0028AD272E|nr:capsular polysaccharide biosynthesis protein [Massilia sp.]